MADVSNVTIEEFIEEEDINFQRNWCFFVWKNDSFSKFPENDEKKRQSLSCYDTKYR